MKKIIVIFLSLILILSIAVSCDENDDKILLDIPEVTREILKPTINVEELNPNNSLNNYDLDEMISLPFNGILPDGVEAVYNDENVTVLKYLSGFSGSTRIVREILINYGINEGKIIFKDYIGYDTSGGTNKTVFKYGYLNSDFSMLTEPIYKMVYPFKHSKAVVETSDGYGVINTDGTVILPCVFNMRPEIYENIIKVPNEKTQGTTTYQIFSTSSGEYIYSVRKENINATDKYRNVKINLDGTEEEIFDVTLFGEEELQKYQNIETKKWGYKNGFGDIVILPIFESAYRFVDERARVIIDEKFGYVNKTGDIVIPCIYSDARNFNNGQAWVVFEGDETYITQDGKRFNDYYYDLIEEYGDGLAAAVINGETNC